MKHGSSKRLFLVFLLGWVTCALQAQTLSISGNIVSKTDGEPIIGASILEQGTSNGTITDWEGNFSLSVQPGAKLAISYIGFKSITVAAADGLRLVLEEDTKVMDEVVVTGYSSQKKADLTGAVAVVKTCSRPRRTTR